MQCGCGHTLISGIFHFLGKHVFCTILGKAEIVFILLHKDCIAISISGFHISSYL